MNTFKKILLTTPLINSTFEYLNKVRLTGTLHVTPLSQSEKADLILHCAAKINSRTFIETGTYKGDTVNACLDHFDKLFSIELSPDLFSQANKRFENIEKVTILQGNSAELIP